MPGSRYAHTTTAHAARERVWEALQEAETWSGIGPIDEVWEDVHSDGELVSFRWAATAAGRRWKGSARTSRVVPGELMELELRSPEVRGSISCGLASSADATTDVTVTMDVAAAGLLATMFWGTVDRAIRSGFAGHVDEFGGRFAE
jgi:hypothetical protein